MPKMTLASLENFVEQAIAHSAWLDSSHIQGNYTAALDSYYGRKKPKHTDGCSGAVSSDVADMVESVTSQIMESFDFQTIATFKPRNTQDVDQARVEALVCNDHLMSKNRGYTIIQEAVRNALLLRNGIIKVYPEKRETVTSRRYRDLSELELLTVTQADHVDQKVDVTRASENDDGSLNITVRKTTTFSKLSMYSVDPVNFLFYEEYDSIDLMESTFCGERYHLSRSDLRQLGHPKKVVDALAATNSDTRIGALARDRGEANPVFFDNGDPSTALIECFELYVRVDFDGDGIAELRRILYVGGVSAGTILENDLWDRVPYASGVVFLQSQRWLGLSLFDKLRDLEDQKTEALRQFLDNMAFANNSEVVVVDGSVELDDLKARRPGGINRVDDINAVRDLVVQAHGQDSILLLNYLDAVRSERGGASLDLQAAQLQVAGETAFGIERQYSTKEMLARLMTRTLSETLIRQVFLLIHHTLRRHFPDQAEVGRGGGAFVQYEPGQWTHRSEVTVVAGQGRAERNSRKVALAEVLQQQQVLQGAGLGDGILIDLSTYHDTLVDWTAAGGLPEAARHWIDPRSQPSIDAQQRALASIEEQQQAQTVQFGQVLESQQNLATTEGVVELAKHQDTIRHRYWSDTLKSLVDEQRVDAQHGTDDANPEATDLVQAQGAARG